MRRWKKALFIYPYKNLKELSYDDIFPPLGLEHIATAVKELVDEITIIDMRYEKKPLSKFMTGVDVVGISITWPHQKEVALNLIEEIPAGISIVVGGIHVTENVNEYFESSLRIDIAVRGDGEEIVQELFSNKPLDQINGISYRQKSKIIHNKTRILSPLKDFYPDRNLRRYLYRHKSVLGVKFGIDTLMSSRGCPYNCEFCTHKLNPLGELREYSSRSPESVVEEIKNIKAKIIVFSDDNFSVDIKRVEKICDLLIVQKIKKTFIVELRIEIVHHTHILEKMQRAGFRVLAIGIESAQDKTLKRIGKGFTIREVKEAFKVLRKFNMLSVGCFIIGYIGETEEDMLEVSSFARGLELDFLNLSKLRALKYSPLRKIVEDTPGCFLTEKGKVFSLEYPPSRISKIFKTVRRDFYRHPQFLKMIKKLFLCGLMKSPEFLQALFIIIIGVMERVFKRRLLRLE